MVDEWRYAFAARARRAGAWPSDSGPADDSEPPTMTRTLLTASLLAAACALALGEPSATCSEPATRADLYIGPVNKGASPMLLHGRYAFVSGPNVDPPLLQAHVVLPKIHANSVRKNPIHKCVGLRTCPLTQ